MKFRSQFVSNSSSTSYVVYIPNSVTIDSFTKERIIEVASELGHEIIDDTSEVDDTEVQGQSDSDEDSDEYDSSYEDEMMLSEFLTDFREFLSGVSVGPDDLTNSSFYGIIETLMVDYVIADVQGGPDDECLIHAEKSVVDRLVAMNTPEKVSKPRKKRRSSKMLKELKESGAVTIIKE